MSNWIVFFVICFISMQIMSLFIEGEVGLATTQLTVGLARNGTVINVQGTDGFFSDDFVTIDAEDICYTTRGPTSFSGLTRGCRDTDAEAHSVGKRVYNDTTGMINRMVGFNILETLANDGFITGSIKLITSVGTIAKSIMAMVIWDYSFLEGSLVWFKYMVLFPISAGLVITLFQLVFRRG